MHRLKEKFISLLLMCSLFTCVSISGAAGYPSNPELEKKLEKLSRTYSQIIALHDLGTTAGGNELSVLTLGADESESKPAILLVAGIDGTDLAGTEILLDFAGSMAKQYGKTDSITQLLNTTTFYILPRVNPDATESLFSKPQYLRSLNARATDLDRDGKVDEDGYDDLNKDGVISRMRIRESGGEWMDDPDYPGLLKKADATKGESGTYRLLWEGIDNDGDGELNEDEPGGVDFNRNFTHRYRYFEYGAGPHQISERETRAVADFAFAHPNIALVFSFSPQDNLFETWETARSSEFSGTGRRNRNPVEKVDPEDGPYYTFISKQFKKMSGLKDPVKGEDGNGTFTEWAYYHFGRWSLSTPAWWPPLMKTNSDSSSMDLNRQYPDKTRRKKESAEPVAKTEDQRLWDWLQSSGQTDGFVEWQAIEHPDFPDKTVEIGGFKPLVKKNPPPDSLKTQSDEFGTFLQHVSGLLARSQINDLNVEDLHDNLYRISLKVSNTGYLPTNTQLGIRNKWMPKIKIALELSEKQQLVSGKVVQFIDKLSGEGGNEAFSWVVMGRKGSEIVIEAGSPSTGMVTRTVVLQ